ncbi:MAG: UDP-N-acetylglucosamine 2-epimerase (non-hydrolyzing) [Nanoarchaeota archaeon]|nr:UDP-N-acetylglucosamine 2-epimerase (non-hydrolyzing) [Nanoarchaeota archaeon]
MKIAIVLGTRPEIIKLSPIIRKCEENGEDYYILHTNQHYSPEMDSIFFEELGLPKPKYNLNVGSGSQGEQIGRMLKGIEKVFKDDCPDIVIVQGDANSVFAGAFVASRLGIKIAHVEAGLRSYDRNMPEEINRSLTDAISDFLFCPTKKQKEILLTEGISREKIFVVGNTIVDAVYWAKNNETKIIERENLERRDYCLMTLHRVENVDNKKMLEKILYYISSLKEEKIIFPLHPRTKKMLGRFNFDLPQNIRTINPVGFLDMITLEKNAKAILTDSGGVQEEACILKVPCITLRTTTERPETIECGGNMLMKENANEDFELMIKKERDWKNPFGEGKTGEKILSLLKNN